MLKFFGLVLFLGQFVYADLAKEFGIEKVEKSPPYAFGFYTGQKYFAQEFDTWFGLNGGTRINKKHFLLMDLKLSPSLKVWELGAEWQYVGEDLFFTEGNEDFILFKTLLASFPEAGETESRYVPGIIFGYGRRQLIWKKFPWGLQFSLEAGYYLKDFVVYEEPSSLGIQNSRGGRAFVGLNVGVFHWR